MSNDVSGDVKTLRVANELAFPPFEFKGEGGKSQGFSIDLMNAIAQAASFKVEVRWLARAYIDFFRETPLLVQIFMIYFGLPAIAQELGFPLNFNRLAAAVVALSLNSAAYIAEIIRAGIQSIEVGQSEAAQSLGLSSS
jgi:His/Glu/Gln/Arg/opine family amino acid ABC transporter permease subunit